MPRSVYRRAASPTIAASSATTVKTSSRPISISSEPTRRANGENASKLSCAPISPRPGPIRLSVAAVPLKRAARVEPRRAQRQHPDAEDDRVDEEESEHRSPGLLGERAAAEAEPLNLARSELAPDLLAARR